MEAENDRRFKGTTPPKHQGHEPIWQPGQAFRALLRLNAAVDPDGTRFLIAMRRVSLAPLTAREFDSAFIPGCVLAILDVNHNECRRNTCRKLLERGVGTVRLSQMSPFQFS